MKSPDKALTSLKSTTSLFLVSGRDRPARPFPRPHRPHEQGQTSWIAGQISQRPGLPIDLVSSYPRLSTLSLTFALVRVVKLGVCNVIGNFTQNLQNGRYHLGREILRHQDVKVRLNVSQALERYLPCTSLKLEGARVHGSGRMQAQVRSGDNQRSLRLHSLLARSLMNSPRHSNGNGQAYQRTNSLQPSCNMIVKQSSGTEKSQCCAARSECCKTHYSHSEEILPTTVSPPNRIDAVLQCRVSAGWIEEESYPRKSRVIGKASLNKAPLSGATAARG